MGVNGKIRIGTIGTGKIVRRFLAGIAKCPLIEYQAVYSRSEEKAKNLVGLDVTNDWSQESIEILFKLVLMYANREPYY